MMSQSFESGLYRVVGIKPWMHHTHAKPTGGSRPGKLHLNTESSAQLRKSSARANRCSTNLPKTRIRSAQLPGLPSLVVSRLKWLTPRILLVVLVGLGLWVATRHNCLVE